MNLRTIAQAIKPLLGSLAIPALKVFARVVVKWLPVAEEAYHGSKALMDDGVLTHEEVTGYCLGLSQGRDLRVRYHGKDVITPQIQLKLFQIAGLLVRRILVIDGLVVGVEPSSDGE